MATYYINGYNTSGGVYPYTTQSDGAPNFHTLLTDLSSVINDDDSIHISNGDYIDDTANDIDIINRLTIYGNSVEVRIKNDGNGFNIHMDGVVFRDMHIRKNDYVSGSMVNIHGNDVELFNCDFDYDTSTGTGSVINMMDVDGTIINNCHISVPLGVPYTYGVYASNANYTILDNNVIDMNGNNGQAITFVGDCGYNKVTQNIIGNFLSTTSGNVAIYFGGNGNYNTISKNVMWVSGSQSGGIVYNASPTGAVDVVMSHNVIVMGANVSGRGALYIPYEQSNGESYFSIINNIIYYKGVVDENDGIAIEASIQRGIIDYNDIYGFTLATIFINNGAPDIINELGPRNIFVDPKILWDINQDKYEITDIRRYYCDKISECIGSGMLHHNIGVGVDGLQFIEDNYVNVVDTVTNDFGALLNREKTITTFFNSVFTETASEFNNIYRHSSSDTSASPYTSKLVYRNQWEFDLDKTFPYTQDDKFYDKPFIYTLANKRDLEPFDGIECPPNPGYGFSAYPGYEEGLWGFPRISYQNGCSPDPCTIQDDYIESIKIEDTVQGVTFWIQDAINPECLDGNNIVNTPPVITIIGANPLRVYQNIDFVDPGATAYDVEDGDITTDIHTIDDINVYIPDTYYIVYVVTDSNGSQVTARRTVEVISTPDITAPVITILGDDPYYIQKDSVYADQGATASDDRDGNVTDDIEVTDTVDTSVIGTYSVTYRVTDSSGNVAVKTRYVNVYQNS